MEKSKLVEHRDVYVVLLPKETHMICMGSDGKWDDNYNYDNYYNYFDNYYNYFDNYYFNYFDYFDYYFDNYDNYYFNYYDNSFDYYDNYYFNYYDYYKADISNFQEGAK